VPSHAVINIAVPSLLTPNIPVVTTGNFFACAEVLPQTIFEEGLAQSHFDEAAIDPDWH
jgi:hypothetical protein